MESDKTQNAFKSKMRLKHFHYPIWLLLLLELLKKRGWFPIFINYKLEKCLSRWKDIAKPSCNKEESP